MNFVSWIFLPFIVVVLGLYYVLPFRWQNRMLLAASCVFYGVWDWRFLGLLFVSTTIDFFVGLGIERAPDQAAKKKLLVASVVANLAILGFFKYFNFFVESASLGLNQLGIATAPWHLNIVLPLGISFYTFHAMSYAIDIYRGELKPIRNLADYMLFVLYFPQLVAGPIARASSLIPQVCNPRTIRKEQVADGAVLIVWGYFKKMVVADNLAPIVNQAFGGADSVTAPDGYQCLFAIYAFAFQIYCDFSGYTDIARGLGKLMGFELAVNFNLPYLASNPTEFWSRWHISLSSWLRDYLYIPLGGNRGGTAKTCRNLLVTMLLGGLWHGAAWNFVVWGGYHGLLLVGHRLLTRRGQVGSAEAGSLATTLQWLLKGIAIGVMFHLTCLGWMFFRAGSLAQIGAFLTSLAGDWRLNKPALEMMFLVALFGGMLWTFELYLGSGESGRKRLSWNFGMGSLVISILMISVFLLSAATSQEFIYFQF